MALYILNKVTNKSLISTLRAIQSLRNYTLYTPDYLHLLKPKIPQYPVINVQIKGYDYPILENYQRLIDTIATHLDIDVDDSYAILGTKLKIETLKPSSTLVDMEYKLEIFERNTQLSHLSSTRLPILIRLLEATVPEGVTLNIGVWEPSIEERRYVPDTTLLELKEELQTMAKK